MLAKTQGKKSISFKKHSSINIVMVTGGIRWAGVGPSFSICRLHYPLVFTGWDHVQPLGEDK